MKQFATLYMDLQIVQQIVGQLPWGQNVILFQVKNSAERLWYAQKAREESWARKDLVEAIKTKLYQCQGEPHIKSSNYLIRLPPPQSQLTHELLKDPYKFHFLALGAEAEEKDIENGLVDQHITKFLLELGQGFAFCGRQYTLKISDKIYRLDLLFYHYRLHCFVVIEIKRGVFKPEHAGQLNFYLSAVDTQLRGSKDEPSIGILLCEKKDRVVAEYALRDLNKPMGVAEYQLSKALPKTMQPFLPTVEELENELSQDVASLSLKETENS